MSKHTRRSFAFVIDLNSKITCPTCGNRHTFNLGSYDFV
jgi:hypothetical protein